MSAIVPPPFVIGAEPNVPLRKRNAMRLLNEGAFAHAITKTGQIVSAVCIEKRSQLTNEAHIATVVDYLTAV
jgi:hypothetical protein